MPRLDAASAVTILLRENADVQDALGADSEEEASARIQGAAPEEGYTPPWVWIEDRGGEPIDRAMGGDWTIRRDAVAIHVIDKTSDATGDIVAAIVDTLDNYSGTVALSGYTSLDVSWITMSAPGDERWEDEPEGVVRSVTAEVTSGTN